MSQPIPKKITENNPEFQEKIYTLLLDMNSIMKMCLVDKRLSSDGLDYGMVFQTLLQIKLMLRKYNFDYVYAFYDGEQSGIMRYDILQSYKANRNKNFQKRYDDTEYNRALDDFCRRVMANKNKSKKEDVSDNLETDDERFERERGIIVDCLDNLFIRNIYENFVEGDDLIAYYVQHKRINENVVIMTSDRDLTQLISKSVCVYIPKLKKFVTPDNHRELMGYSHENVLLKKIICGDASDNIKGVKGVGEKTLFDNFPEIKERKMSLEEIVDGARIINEERTKNKKKPLKWAENIVLGYTDGDQGCDLYRINRRLMDLSVPMLTKEAVDTMESFMYAPLDPEGRSYENLYRIIVENNVEDLKNEDNFSRFFSDFAQIIDKEKKRN